MTLKILVTKKFVKEMKIYSKKFRHVEDDVMKVINELEKGNLIGDMIKDLKLNEEEAVFKVRAINSDTNSGKSNGYRILYNVVKNENVIYLLTIYYKKEKKNISNKEIGQIIQKYCN